MRTFLIFIIKSGMYITAPEPISTTYCINPSHQFVCLYVYPPFRCYATASQKHYRGNEYTCNERTVGGVIFYAVRVVPKEAGN
jgi:hypothetical protein